MIKKIRNIRRIVSKVAFMNTNLNALYRAGELNTTDRMSQAPPVGLRCICMDRSSGWTKCWHKWVLLLTQSPLCLSDGRQSFRETFLVSFSLGLQWLMVLMAKVHYLWDDTLNSGWKFSSCSCQAKLLENVTDK